MATECIGAMVLITKLFQTDSNLVLFISLFVNCSVNLWHTVQYSILQDRTVQNSKVQLSPVRQLSCKDKWNCANCRIKWYCANCHNGTNGFWVINCHIGTNGFWVINCHIGTNGIDTSVLLGQMELSQLLYWDKWNWLNCPFDTTVILCQMELSQLSLSQLFLSQLSFCQMSWHRMEEI